MAKQTINVGAHPNDGSGDALRTAFTKINENFTELYTGGLGGGNLGSYKFQGYSLGTQAIEGEGWGGYPISIDPGGESNGGIWIPKPADQSDGANLQIYNNNEGGSGIQLLTFNSTWTFRNNGIVAFPNNAIDFGTQTADLKSSTYAELWYHGVNETWQANPTFNSESYIWTAADGSFIANTRADDGNMGPQWNHQWTFGNDGKFYGPMMGDVQFGQSIQTSNGNGFFESVNGHTNAIQNSYNPLQDSTLILSTVPANQLMLHGSQHGFNGEWGNPVSMFDLGLIFTGYTGGPNNDHAIVTPDGSLSIKTGVQDSRTTTYYDSEDAFLVASYTDNTITIQSPDIAMAAALMNMRIGDEINLHVGVDVYSGDLTQLVSQSGIIYTVIIDSTASTTYSIDQIEFNALTSSTHKNWTFNYDGSIAFPNVPTNIRTGSAEALVFTKTSGNQKSISTQSGTVDNPSVERLVIAGGDGYGNGEGGDIYLWAGRSSLNAAGGQGGGDIKVDAGDGYDVGGGTVKIRGGNAHIGDIDTASNGGWIQIQAGSSWTANGSGGNLDIQAGYGYNDGTDGAVTIQAGKSSYQWRFDPEGKLTLPGTIVNSQSNITGTNDPIYPTAIDLTKTINKLENNTGSNYTLADGVEGQIIYLVPRDGATNDSVYIIVNHGRVLNNSGATTAAVFTDIAFNPFGTDTAMTSNVITMIFTDGAWQSSGGVWD
jgi:hypothetical protein